MLRHVREATDVVSDSTTFVPNPFVEELRVAEALLSGGRSVRVPLVAATVRGTACFAGPILYVAYSFYIQQHTVDS